jgi:hypothetical protein
MDLRDVRMVERGQRLRLALEAGHALRIAGELVGENFQRDVTVELGVARAVDLPHSAFADQGGHFIRA